MIFCLQEIYVYYIYVHQKQSFETTTVSIKYIRKMAAVVKSLSIKAIKLDGSCVLPSFSLCRLTIWQNCFMLIFAYQAKIQKTVLITCQRGQSADQNVFILQCGTSDPPPPPSGTERNYTISVLMMRRLNILLLAVAYIAYCSPLCPYSCSHLPLWKNASQPVSECGNAATDPRLKDNLNHVINQNFKM